MAKENAGSAAAGDGQRLLTLTDVARSDLDWVVWLVPKLTLIVPPPLAVMAEPTSWSSPTCPPSVIDRPGAIDQG